MAYKNFFEEIANYDSLKNKLELKGKNHQTYSFYADEFVIMNTLNEGLRLYTNNNWNDTVDQANINDDDTIRFVKCLTYSRSENIAMWMLYATDEEKSYMLKFKKGYINSLLNNEKTIEIYEDNRDETNKKETSICELKSNEYRIFITDVVYVGEGDNDSTIALKKSIYGRNDFLKEEFRQFDITNNKYSYFAKSYGWFYENECRLVIEVSRSKIEKLIDSNKKYYVLLDAKPSEQQFDIFRNPNNNNNSLFNCNDSFYKNKINWSMKKKYFDLFQKEKCNKCTNKEELKKEK